MHKNNNLQITISANGINYYIVKNELGDSRRQYGIGAVMAIDNTDYAEAENLFFTEAEATEYCKWLAENEVYPISLCEVMANIYIL